MKNKIVFLIISVLVVIGIMIGVITIRDLNYERLLSEEVNKLALIDITKDQVSVTIETGSDYAIIEKTIKEYLKDYSELLQEILAIINEEKIIRILSLENYSTDGPEFNESLAYIETTKSNFNTKFDKLVEMTSRDYIEELIKDKKLDKYYEDLYHDLMLGDDSIFVTKLEETEVSLEDSRKVMNNTFDVQLEILNFLKDNKDNWKIEDNQVKFFKDDLLSQYNALIEKIK